MRWAGHAAYINRWEMHTKFWSEKLKGTDHSEDLCVMKGKKGGKVWAGFIWLRMGTSNRLL